MQNFLTMEFYRKICNKCYWSNIYNSKHSVVKQSLIIFISFISVLFFSFFYLPTDPANANKSSYSMILRNFVSNFRINLQNITGNVTNRILQYTSSFIDLQQTKFTSRDILVLKSSLLI
ncbi:MAG: hypothetical protein ABI462_04420 [Ignavibacteria bacterium]